MCRYSLFVLVTYFSSFLICLNAIITHRTLPNITPVIWQATELTMVQYPDISLKAQTTE